MISLSDEREAERRALDSLAADETDSPEDALRRREVTRLVHATLDDLPEKYADALKWKYLEERARRSDRRTTWSRIQGGGVTADARPRRIS